MGEVPVFGWRVMSGSQAFACGDVLFWQWLSGEDAQPASANGCQGVEESYPVSRQHALL